MAALRPRRHAPKKPDASYIYHTPGTSKKQRKKEKKEQRRLMQVNPEQIFYDYALEELECGVVSCPDEPCNAKFYTKRPDKWIQVCESYYQLTFNDIKEAKQRTVSVIEFEPMANITITIYHNGTVMLQGKAFQTWEQEVYPELQQLVERNDVRDSESDAANKCITPTRIPYKKTISCGTPKNKIESAINPGRLRTYSDAEISTTQGQNTASSSTPGKTGTTSARTQLLFSLTPTNNPKPVDQELIDNEERSLTSLLNGTDDPLFASQDESLRSLIGTEDESFKMLTLVRPSMIPEDVEKSPMHQIRELQGNTLKANIRITELEEEKRVLTETVKDLRIQLSISTSAVVVQKANSKLSKRKPKQAKSHEEMQKQLTEIEIKNMAKTKENELLTSKVSELESRCVSLTEENEILLAKLASLGNNFQETLGDPAAADISLPVSKDDIGDTDFPPSPDSNKQQKSKPTAHKTEEKRNETMKNRPKTVRAFRGEMDPLSNFYNMDKNKLPYKGKHFSSSEQAYQYTKTILHGEKNLAKEILQETNPRKIKKLGDIRESVAWNKQKVTILEEILLSKAGCCAEFRAEVEVPNVVFVEAVQDPFWGSGMPYEETRSTKPGKWRGANMMGVLLSRIRSKLPTILRPKSTRMPALHQNPTTTTKANQQDKQQTRPATSEATAAVHTEANQQQDKQTGSVLIIVGDSMIRNVHIKPQITEIRKFTMSGARIEDINSRLPGILGNKKPNNVVMHVGTNNLVKDNPDMLRQKYCNLIRHAKESCPGAKITISGIFQRSDRDHLVTTVAQANEILQELCAAYTVQYMDNMSPQNRGVHILKRDGLHLSRTGVSDLSERLLDKLNGQPPFQYPQKGPAMWQECRGGRQNFNSLQRTNTNNLVPLTGSYAHQPRPSRVAMRQDTYQQTAQVNQRYLDVTGQVPWTNPPYPVHIMPRYPLIAKM